MSMMARLMEADDLEERWKVLPMHQFDQRSIAKPEARFRLMEEVGKGQWIERQTGKQRELQQLADLYNKEGYIRPLTKQQQSEVARFSVMERARITTLH